MGALGFDYLPDRRNQQGATAASQIERQFYGVSAGETSPGRISVVATWSWRRQNDGWSGRIAVMIYPVHVGACRGVFGMHQFLTATNRRWLAAGVVTLGLLSACSVTADDAASAELDVILTESNVIPFERFADMVDFSEAIVHVRLVEVVDGFRFPVDPEGDTQGIGYENVGLVFDVLETFSGEVDTTRLTVDWRGYQIDLDSRVRLARMRSGIFDFTKELPGNEFVIAVVFAEDIGYRVVSPDGMLRVTDNGALTGAIGPTLERFDINTLDSLRAASAEVSRPDAAGGSAPDEAEERDSDRR